MELIAQNSLVTTITNLRYVKCYYYFLYSVHSLGCQLESTSQLSQLFYSLDFPILFLPILLSWRGFRKSREDLLNHKFWNGPIPRWSEQFWYVQVGRALQQGDFGRRVQHGDGGQRAGEKSVCNLWRVLIEDFQPSPSILYLTLVAA